jgi:hypothetical protein
MSDPTPIKPLITGTDSVDGTECHYAKKDPTKNFHNYLTSPTGSLNDCWLWFLKWQPI